MAQKVLYIAIIWNQHQPYYMDREQNELIMPWVRLHAAKDYYQMAAIQSKYPEIKTTFSLSPSLLEQLQAYLEKGAIDSYLKVMKKARDLTLAEKTFLLLHYFDIQWDKVIGAHHYYRQLLERQGRITEPDRVEEALKRFSSQDYLDLQVWFNLVWIDPEIRAGDYFLKGLQEKGRNFTEEEKEELLARQFSIMEKVIPEHRRLQQNKMIELATTAYYHPILPLIIDNHSALRPSPGLTLPRRFQFGDDARVQVEMALEQFNQIFGTKPCGFWPPEQAVSPEVIPLLADAGLKWTVSDEQILTKSLENEIYRDSYGHVLNPDFLYRPYLACAEGAELPIIFRDHHLSDRIGFVYQYMSGEHAAGDLVHRLQHIRENLSKVKGNHLVTIALDGENAWEWYPEDKTSFLHNLYRLLSSEPYLETVTVSEYLHHNYPTRRINRLATGSWVDHSLTRWIGTEHKNMIWDYLLEARQAVERQEKEEGETERIKYALQNIYQAEGSDFAWWVDSMPYNLAAPFEALLRRHLTNVYTSLEQKTPDYLYRPVLHPEHENKVGEHFAGPVSIAPGRRNEQ